VWVETHPTKTQPNRREQTMKPKNYEELEAVVTDYFNDSRRSAAETKEDLNGIIEHVETLLETMNGDE
jgi:hypothetical protein